MSSINGLAKAVIAGVTASLLLLSGGVVAADYPTRPIILVVPTTAGGTADTVTRILADKLKVELGQPVIVENRPGANGYIAASYVMRSKPDGYVLLSYHDYFAAGPFIQKSFNINLAEDMDHIAYPVEVWSHLLTNKSSAFKTFPAFLAYAKANPGKVSLGAAPLSTKFDAAVLFDELGIDVFMVSYQTGPDATQGLLSNTVDLLITSYAGPIRQQADKGNAVPLAYLGPKKSELTPELSSIKEFAPNFPGIGATQGISGPKGMPADVVAKLNQAINKVLKDPDVVKRLSDFGFTIVDDSTPTRWKTKLIQTAEKYRRASKLLKFQPE